MVLWLVLMGKYAGDSVTHRTSRRLVSVDLDKKEELADIGRFYCPDCEQLQSWGLGNAESGFWRIVEAYEVVDPVDALHEDKYPMSSYLEEWELDDLIEAAKAAAGVAS